MDAREVMKLICDNDATEIGDKYEDNVFARLYKKFFVVPCTSLRPQCPLSFLQRSPNGLWINLVLLVIAKCAIAITIRAIAVPI